MSLPLRHHGPGRRLARAGALAALLTLAAPGLAHADSLVFVKDHDVWLAQPDGSGQYQVTRDGTGSQPYRSPTQADDGTIVAARGTEIVRMRQNGSVINRMDPPALSNSVSQRVDGPPVDVAVSPDGSKVVYSLVNVTCPIAGPECGARPVTAITPADRMAPVGNAYTSGSSWITNTRVLSFAGFLHQVNTLDYGQTSEVHWFDDQQVFGQGNSTDQSDGEVNRQGSWVATIRGYGDKRSIMWLKVPGDVATGSRPAGTLGVPTASSGCLTGTTTDLSGPTWSPGGTSLAWREEGAIHVLDDVTTCGPASRPVIQGGSEPDWGPADVNPGEREGSGPPPGGPPPGGGTPPGSGGQKPGTGGGTAAKATLKASGTRRLAAALKRGIVLRAAGVRPGRRTFTATAGGRKVASGTAVVSQAGTATVTLRFTAKAKRSLGKRKRVALKVTGGSATLTLTVTR